MSNKSSIHRRVSTIKERPRCAGRRAQGCSRLFRAKQNAARSSERRTVLGRGVLVPQTPGYCSRLAQPVPGSLTRPHMPPSNVASRSCAEKFKCERRNGGVGPIRRDGGKGHLTDARRLAGQDVCTYWRCVSCNCEAFGPQQRTDGDCKNALAFQHSPIDGMVKPMHK